MARKVRGGRQARLSIEAKRYDCCSAARYRTHSCKQANADGRRSLDLLRIVVENCFLQVLRDSLQP